MQGSSDGHRSPGNPLPPARTRGPLLPCRPLSFLRGRSASGSPDPPCPQPLLQGTLADIPCGDSPVPPVPASAAPWTRRTLPRGPESGSSELSGSQPAPPAPRRHRPPASRTKEGSRLSWLSLDLDPHTAPSRSPVNHPTKAKPQSLINKLFYSAFPKAARRPLLPTPSSATWLGGARGGQQRSTQSLPFTGVPRGRCPGAGPAKLSQRGVLPDPVSEDQARVPTLNEAHPEAEATRLPKRQA